MVIQGSYLVLIVSILFPTTMIITFTLAVTSKHVYPVMPFMSYTGDRPVESCIFSFGLNLTAGLYIIICNLRYNHIAYICEEGSPPHSNSLLRLNRNSLTWGMASALGLSVTGSFQERNLPTAHRMGALTCSYCGFIYLWYQTIISDLLVGKLNSRKVYYLRIMLSLASTSIHVIAPILMVILDNTYPKCHEETLHWSIEEDGWHLHVCCSFMEWIVFFINVTYLASFYDEFKLIEIHEDYVTFKLLNGQTNTSVVQASTHRKLQ